MTKGTPSLGKKNKKSHIHCRRCGRHSYHVKHKTCAACGFGRSSKLKTWSWRTKTINRMRKK